MTKTRKEKGVPPGRALEIVQSKGYAQGLSKWTLQKMCRDGMINHERSGPGKRAKILIKPSVVLEFAKKLNH